MVEKTYTVKEIDALKRVHENKYLYGRYSPVFSSGGFSRSYMAAEKDSYVEGATRTSMMAGHTAEDLIASEQSK